MLGLQSYCRAGLGLWLSAPAKPLLQPLALGTHPLWFDWDSCLADLELLFLCGLRPLSRVNLLSLCPSTLLENSMAEATVPCLPPDQSHPKGEG